MSTPLLILYGSQTGNAQDVAEAIGREACLLGFRPRVLPMDAYPVAGLPGERAVVLVASTTGQGEPPDNMRRFWRFLLRKSLAPGSLAATRYAVFGLGDSAYVKFNDAAKKLDRRLAALGAAPLVERGLGDDQDPGGYESALDSWLPRLWAALAEAFPPPPGTAPPAIGASARLQLGPPKFRVTLLPTPGLGLAPGDPAGGAAGGAAGGHLQNGGGAAAQGPGVPWAAQAQEGGEGQEGAAAEEERIQREAVAAAAAFRAVALAAAGLPPDAAAGLPAQGQQAPAHGPWRPFMAPVLVNQRLTSEGHFQDTRHIEFGTGGSGLAYEPGDLLAVFPRTPEADVRAMLERLGLDGRQLIRVAARQPAAEAAEGQPAAAEAQPAASFVATAHAIVQGVMDVSGASPRRYLFQVLQQYATVERERERLAYFASPEGRDELYDYNQREKRTLLEVLQDFPSAAVPLERLLEAAPLLRPRLFSISSSPLAHPGRAHITAAVVRYATPFKRQKRGLLTTWLAGLAPPAPQPRPQALLGPCSGAGPAPPLPTAAEAAAEAEAVAARAPRVPVWVERGCLRMPMSPRVPLLLVGPGTGVAPFRSFLWQRAFLLQRWEQQQQQQQQPNGLAHAQPPAAAAAPPPPAAAAGPDGPPAPCVLFFGCRHPERDFYYQREWEELARIGALKPGWGLVAAFSRPEGAGEGGGGGSGAAVAPGRKTYVTHRIEEHGAQVWRLLSEQGGCVYISGSAQKMPAGVAAALAGVARDQGGLGQEAAAKWVRQLETGGRYFVEAWS